MPPPPHVFYSPSLRCWVLGDAWTVGINGSTLTVPEGYCFDMASVPRILGQWIQQFDLGTAAPLTHDVGYANGGRWPSWPPLVWSRSQVDHLFHRMMRDEGVGWRRHPAYIAVRLFGWLAWKRKGSQQSPRPCCEPDPEVEA